MSWLWGINILVHCNLIALMHSCQFELALFQVALALWSSYTCTVAQLPLHFIPVTLALLPICTCTFFCPLWSSCTCICVRFQLHSFQASFTFWIMYFQQQDLLIFVSELIVNQDLIKKEPEDVPMPPPLPPPLPGMSPPPPLSPDLYVEDVPFSLPLPPIMLDNTSY